MAGRISAPTILVALVVAAAAPASAERYDPPGRTQRVLALNGAEPNDQVFSEPLGISADGRYVSFSSFATNFVEGDTNEGSDTFVLDRQSGSIERVSVTSGGEQAGGSSFESSMSADGRFVAFASWAEDLVTGDNNDTYDVFVRDRKTKETERVSVLPDGTQGNFGAEQPAISADGRFVAFTWHARNLPADTNSAGDVYVHDRETGTTELASVSGSEAQGDGLSNFPSITADGRYVLFLSEATNLVSGDVNHAVERRHGWDVFLRDRLMGTTRRVSVASDGTGGNGRSMNPEISADGSTVAFLSGATNLVPQDTNGAFDVFVHDLTSQRTERVAVTSDGTEGDPGFAGNFVGMSISLSADGRFVAFGSTSTDLVEGDGNSDEDVFVHDRLSGQTERISVSTITPPGGGGNYPAISADGETVAFTSYAKDLLPGDTTDTPDLYVRDRGPAVGPGEIHATRSGDSIQIEGWVRLQGETLSSGTDRAEDAGMLGRRAGGEITGGRLIMRPESDDLVIEISLAELPAVRPAEAASGYPTSGGFIVCTGCSVPSAGGAPAVVYGAELEAGDVRYEVRASRFGGEGAPHQPSFSLHRCSATCERVAGVSGGYGMTGEEIRVSVPLSLLGPASEIDRARMFTLVGDPDADVFTLLDEMPLPAFSLAGPVLEVGTAPSGTRLQDVVFDTAGSLSGGAFSATLGPGGAPYSGDVWVRACLGATCAARSAPLD